MSGSQTTISAALLGKTVTFRSKNTLDEILWTGRFEGLVTAVIAQNYADLVSYNANVRLADTTVSADVTTLNFFIITLANTTGPAQKYAFAEEWILSGSFEVIDQQTQVTVIVYDSPNADHGVILTALRAAGYNCYIASTTS